MVFQAVLRCAYFGSFIHRFYQRRSAALGFDFRVQGSVGTLFPQVFLLPRTFPFKQNIRFVGTSECRQILSKLDHRGGGIGCISGSFQRPNGLCDFRAETCRTQNHLCASFDDHDDSGRYKYADASRQYRKTGPYAKVFAFVAFLRSQCLLYRDV